MRRVVGGLTVLAVASGTAPHVLSAQSSRQISVGLHRLVNPLIGTGNDDQGDTIPGPALPAGSIHPSPEMLSGSNAGYDAAAPISGFAQLHTQGSGGVPSYGTFLVSPQTGALALEEAAHLSPARAQDAAADGYEVTLARYDTRVEIAPAHHAALYRFTFPDGETSHILFDVTRKIGGVLASDGAEVHIAPDGRRIAGRVRAKGYWSPALVDIWFAAEVDQAPTGWGIAAADAGVDGRRDAQVAADRPLRAWLTFATRRDRPVSMKIAVSFAGADRARDLLAADIPGWDIAAVRADAATAWDAVLSRVTIDGVGAADRRRFYTALYHSHIQPRDRSRDQAPADRSTPLWDDHYTLWDTYHTAFPLMSVLRPADYAGAIASFVRTRERFGAVDTAFIAGRNYHVGQGGDEVDNVIGEGLLRGVPGVDWTKAADVALFNAFERRRPRYLIDGLFAVGDCSPEPDNQRAKSGSSTVAMALNDFYAAKLAAATGRTEEAALLAARAGSWRNVWDAAATSDGFTGFVGPRFADGRFQENDPKRGWDGRKHQNFGFYEGTGWIYSYAPVHDVPGMVAAMGGRARFIERLRHAFAANLIDYTNEPSFSTPWLFSDVGRPDLASYWANRVFERFTANAYPGDEDSGAMSSHYVFNRLGLFPKLGSDLYYLHAPHQPRATIALAGGKRFTIVATGYRPGAVYIRAARLNGRPIDRPYIAQRDIMAGGTLELDVGSRPNGWGQAAPLVP